MTNMHIVLLDSDDRIRLPLKRMLMQYGFIVTDCTDLSELYVKIDNHYATASNLVAVPLFVLINGVTFSSEFVDKQLPAMRRAYPMLIAIQCPEDQELRVQLLDRGADLCLSDRCSPEEVSANLWAQARRLPVSWAAPSQSLGLSGRPMAGHMPPLASQIAPLSGQLSPLGHAPGSAMNDRMATYHAHAPEAIGQFSVSGMTSTRDEHSLLPDARLAEATAELQRKVYGTWTLAHEDWILVNPLGAHIGLTGVERRCIAQLADNERREFPRDMANEMGRGGFKSMSVVVSRMRKKVNRAGVPLPLHTVHGMGYVFIGKLIRKPAA